MKKQFKELETVSTNNIFFTFAASLLLTLARLTNFVNALATLFFKDCLCVIGSVT